MVPGTWLAWIARVFLLGAAGGAVVASLVATRGHHPPARGASAAVYACPMHPEVVTPQPSDCPICGMALEAVTTAAARTADAVIVPSETGGARPYELQHVVAWPLAREMVAPAWTEGSDQGTALFPADEIALLVPGERGTFSSIASPVAQDEIQLLNVPSAALPRDEVLHEVHFRVVRAASPGRAGAGTARFAARTHAALTVPASAVLESPRGPYVFVASQNGRTFTRRDVTLGRVWRERAVVAAGLLEGEQVVTARAFLVDAERLLLAGAAVGGGAAPAPTKGAP